MGAKWKESTRKSYRKQVKAIGANVLAIRKIRGMSKADVARESGLSVATVARVEEGKQPACKPTLDKLYDWISRYQGQGQGDQNSHPAELGPVPPRQARRVHENGSGSIQVRGEVTLKMDTPGEVAVNGPMRIRWAEGYLYLKPDTQG